jgi:hypothetical protein
MKSQIPGGSPMFRTRLREKASWVEGAAQWRSALIGVLVLLLTVSLLSSCKNEIFGGPDNCPTVFNPDQTDTDGDGDGNACDLDDDNDGVFDDADNCSLEPNPGQADPDGDGVGDECDNCPVDFNPDQDDMDDDGVGDACEI